MITGILTTACVILAGVTYNNHRALKQYQALARKCTDRREEYILCSALYYDDNKPYVHQPKNIATGFVVLGRGHHNAFSILYTLTPASRKLEKSKIKQGFLTSADRFVDRYEAFVLAQNSRQIATENDVDSGRLHSEDLW